MKTKIETNLEHPKELEQFYRDNKTLFAKTFKDLYPEISHHPTARVWYERLTYSEISWGGKNELLLILGLSFIAGLIARIPFVFSLEPDYFYARNLAFIVFPALAAFFAWKQSLPFNKILIVAVSILASVMYMNLVLPTAEQSDTFTLAGIHLPLFMWSVLGYVFTGNQFNSTSKRIDYLRYNGDLVVMTTVILISGAILSAVTINLFELINIRLEEFYFENIAIWGLAAAPIVGTYLVQSNPQLVKNISPVIAKVFTPLVLTTLVIYLGAIIYTGKDPYNDREFLIIFNVLLIGVMAIILFSIAETSAGAHKINSWMVFTLSTVTIIINAIALSAIVFRISEWGITPNRLAVLGSNILILIHLIMVSYRLFQSLKHSDELVKVENSIASYLPVYSIWTIIVTFLFPVFFGFK